MVENKEIGNAKNNAKTKSYKKNQYKKTTGTVISPDNKLLVPNKLQHKIFKLKKLSVALRCPTTFHIREKAIIEAGGGVDFRDKYLGLIYDKCESLLDYFARLGRCSVFTVSTSGCADELKKQLGFIENEKKSLLSEGLVNEIGARYTATEADYNNFLSKNLTILL